MWNPDTCMLLTSEIPLDFGLLLSHHSLGHGWKASTVHPWTEACHIQGYKRPDTSLVLLLNLPLRHLSHSIWDFRFCTRPCALSNRGKAWMKCVATLFGDTVIKYQITILLYTQLNFVFCTRPLQQGKRFTFQCQDSDFYSNMVTQIQLFYSYSC